MGLKPSAGLILNLPVRIFGFFVENKGLDWVRLVVPDHLHEAFHVKH